MTYIVLVVYCLLAVMFILGVTFHHELLNERLRKKKG
jgi:hypothetical protein